MPHQGQVKGCVSPLSTPLSSTGGASRLLTTGGISPITKDFVNPEKPWPHLGPLAAATAAAGKALLPRLPVYPPYLAVGATGHNSQGWLHESDGGAGIGAAVRRHSDSYGLARASSWCPGGVGEADGESGGEASQEPTVVGSSEERALPAEGGSAHGAAAVVGSGGSSSSGSSGGGSAGVDGSADRRSSIPQVQRRQHRLWQVW